MQQCKPVTGDLTAARVTWQDKKAIERPVDTPLGLAFELKNAKLYSFWIE
jgi:hypothetical protein